MTGHIRMNSGCIANTEAGNNAYNNWNNIQKSSITIQLYLHTSISPPQSNLCKYCIFNLLISESVLNSNVLKTLS